MVSAICLRSKINFCIKKDHIWQLFEPSLNSSSYCLLSWVLRSKDPCQALSPGPIDIHRAEPLLGTSFLALTQEISSKAVSGSAASTEIISWKSALLSNISSSSFCRCLLRNFYGTFWDSCREVIPAAGKHILLRLFSGNTCPTFNQHQYIEMLKYHGLLWRTWSPPGNSSLLTAVQVNAE